MTTRGFHDGPTVCTSDDRARIESLLHADVAVNTYLFGVLARPCANPVALCDDGRFFASSRRGTPAAVIYASHTGLIVPYGQDPTSLAQLASAIWRNPTPPSATSSPSIRLVVGPYDAVGAVLGGVGTAFRPRLDRGQRLYELTARDLVLPPDAVVDRAGLSDVPELATLLAMMQAEEFGLDPKQFDTPAFITRIRILVETGRVFVKRQAGEIVFHVSANAASALGAQVEAVYTARHCRGRGLATRALGAAAHMLLTTLPRLVLGVADDNTPAVHLYRRLGFQPTAKLRLATA